MTDRNRNEQPTASGILPTDPFDRALSRLVGLPNGAHVAPAVVQSIDFYGHTTAYMVETVKTDDGPTAFVTQVNAAGHVRYILPPAVLKLIDRQRDAATMQVRRRHGKALADARRESGDVPSFTPAMRAKAAATRRANAAKRAARRARKAVK